MWFQDSIFYQIFPLGFCGAPEINDGIEKNRIEKVIRWIPHMKKLGVDAVYFCPVFESGTHGYDTHDLRKIDCRLGSNNDFKKVCEKLHENSIKIIIDGVFNHVGRGFWAFQDVLRNRENSAYKDWFYMDFGKNNDFNDGLWYEGWEGHYELVKLNLKNKDVINHISDAVKYWISEFAIDGIRLDVAYMLDHDFMGHLRSITKEIRDDFFLIGEAIHGNYNTLVNEKLLDSCTNYEGYKGLYSSFNDRNLFEIAYSLNRQFGNEHWSVYKGKNLFIFADNHDVTRAASILKDKNHLPLLYGLMFAMPGIPCLYYGSEWGAQGEKKGASDAALRPSFDVPKENELSEFISKLAKIHKSNKAFTYGSYTQLFITNLQLGFMREHEGAKFIIAVNADSNEYTVKLNHVQFFAENMFTGKEMNFHGDLKLAPYSITYLKVKQL